LTKLNNIWHDSSLDNLQYTSINASHLANSAIAGMKSVSLYVVTHGGISQLSINAT